MVGQIATIMRLPDGLANSHVAHTNRRTVRRIAESPKFSPNGRFLMSLCLIPARVREPVPVSPTLLQTGCVNAAGLQQCRPK